MKQLNGYRMKMVLVGFVAAVVLGGGNAKAHFTWTLKADMPTPRRLHSVSVVNDKIYVVGGISSEPDVVVLSTVEEYDPATDTWTRKADMPMARTGSTSVVSGKIYVIGGTHIANATTSDVEEYDPVTDTWTRKADIPTPRRQPATCVINGKIYAIGGLTGAAVQGSNIVEEYDPATDTWTRKASMSGGLWGLCANVVNGKIYVLGGRPGYTAIPWVREYDPATDTWTRKADMPVGTSQMASVVLDDKIILIGGWRSSGDKVYSTVQMYDPETDIWTMEADAPFLRAAFSASVVNNRIYAIGGTDRIHPCPATSTVYEFGPILDFNCDEIIDAGDICIMVDNWHTDNTLCDIAPPPFGDGYVDVQDLIVLAEHLFEEVNLVAHWALDETEGMFAADSVGGNDAFIVGGTAWKPNSGQVDGALELDGVDGFAIAGEVLDPADGPFSIFAWVKGGASGQVVVSQQGFADWLTTDAEGNLITDLKCSGRSAGPLYCETVITDGQWHRIGLVWDGSNRTLYVDGVTVAEDVQPGLEGSQMGLYIGTGKAMEPGTYFSGLIDDVRIYNRVVSP